MDPKQLTTFANEKLKEYGLYQSGWRFRFDRARTRFGVCRYHRKLITLSRTLAEQNERVECEDTVLHEIAHALAGKQAGHGPAWKKICAKVGAKPIRCYGREQVNLPEPEYWAICPSCEQKLPYYRLPRTVKACGPCCREHNGGRYDARFRFKIIHAESNQEINPGKEKGQRAPKYQGKCPSCGKVYPFYRKQNFNKACGHCCKKYTGGRFDERFRLTITRLS